MRMVKKHINRMWQQVLRVHSNNTWHSRGWCSQECYKITQGRELKFNQSVTWHFWTIISRFELFFFRKGRRGYPKTGRKVSRIIWIAPNHNYISLILGGFGGNSGVGTGNPNTTNFTYTFHGDPRATFAEFFGTNNPFESFFTGANVPGGTNPVFTDLVSIS